VIRWAKVVCASCGKHWSWELLGPEQLHLFEAEPSGARVIEHSCPDCKAKAIGEAGVGPLFAKPLSDEREGRIFKAWSGPGRRTA
jgi:hypothetical protein